MKIPKIKMSDIKLPEMDFSDKKKTLTYGIYAIVAVLIIANIVAFVIARNEKKEVDPVEIPSSAVSEIIEEEIPMPELEVIPTPAPTPAIIPENDMYNYGVDFGEYRYAMIGEYMVLSDYLVAFQDSKDYKNVIKDVENLYGITKSQLDNMSRDEQIRKGYATLDIWEYTEVNYAIEDCEMLLGDLADGSNPYDAAALIYFERMYPSKNVMIQDWEGTFNCLIRYKIG